MSEGHAHAGAGWFKLFVGALAGLEIFFLIMISQCTFSVADSLAAFNSFLCVAYTGFALFCFIAGILVCAVGIDRGKRSGKSPLFYYLFIIYFLLVTLGPLAYKFL